MAIQRKIHVSFLQSAALKNSRQTSYNYTLAHYHPINIKARETSEEEGVNVFYDIGIISERVQRLEAIFSLH